MPSILVVEDKAKWVKEVFLPGLRDAGYLVQLAGTKDEAIGQLGQMEFDAVVLNPNLRVERDFLGERVLAAIVRHSPLTPCILVSGNPFLNKARTGRYEYQIYALLYKGQEVRHFDLDELFQTIDEAIQDRALVRRLLSILNDHLSDSECEQAIGDIAHHYKSARFQAPPDCTDNTKKQKLAYMIAILVSSLGPEGISTLCDIVRGLKPHDHDLRRKLSEICPVAGGSWPAPEPLPAELTYPSIDPDHPPVEAIHDLMVEAFTAVEMPIFCSNIPVFKSVVARFGLKYNLEDMVQEVITFCRTELLWNELLAGIREKKPNQYARFAPRIHGFTPGQ